MQNEHNLYTYDYSNNIVLFIIRSLLMGSFKIKEFISLDATWMLRLFHNVGITKFTIPKLVF